MLFKNLIIDIALLIALFLIIAKPAFGAEVKTITIVNPVRGSDFWVHPQSILDTPKKQYEVIAKNNLDATWLVRSDALKDGEVVKFFKSLNSKQEIGLFLEVTPSLASEAKVVYNQSPNWHFAQSVFLTGYSPDDRKKMIDQAFEKFKQHFGIYPKSVGAWWIDAASLSYMKQKYNIAANLDVADQYSTDQYQIWGQYFSTPFYPSKLNALIPASSKEQKIGTVTIQWATRDPYNGYGGSVDDSTYSVQANDYLLHKLDIEYFKKLIKIYPHVTVGLENDFNWDDFGTEYRKQIETIAQKIKSNTASVKTMSSYAQYYQSIYPTVSPNVIIFASDLLGGTGKVLWYQTPRYRVGWFYNPAYGSAIRDLRLFNDSMPESCFSTACRELNFAITASKALDDVTFQTRWVIDEGTISQVNVSKTDERVEISYINSSNTKRKITLLPNDIQIDGQIQPVSFAIISALNLEQTRTGDKLNLNLGTNFDYSKNGEKIAVNALKFTALVILFFILPGYLLTRSFLLSVPAGFTLFTFLAFITGPLNYISILWLIPIISGVLIFKALPIKLLTIKFSLSNIILTAVVTLGSLSWVLTQVKNGLLYQFGLGYWGPNGHDGIWHLALISQLQKNFPPQNPVFAGTPLENYHYFYDLLLARPASLFGIDPQELLFRLFPPLLAVLTGALTYQVTKQIAIKLNKENLATTAGILATFFVYFGGSFGFIIEYMRSKTFGGESIFWAQQSMSTLLNPPFAASLVIFLTGLYLFHTLDFQNKQDKLKIFTIAILWGTLIEFKAYGGILVLLSLGLLTLEKIIKKDFTTVLLFAGCLIVGLVVFLPNNLNSISLLMFSPFWLIWSMINFQDRLGWYRLSLTLESGVWYKVVAANILGLLVFMVGNLGTRVVGILSFKELFSQRILFYIVLFAAVLPLLFIQKGNNWNIIQFFYYFLFVMSIFAGITLSSILKKVGAKAQALIILIIVLLTIPTTLNSLGQYLPQRPPARLSLAELESLQFLTKQPQGTILTLAFEQNLKLKYSEPVPLVAYASTGYVSAFSGHQTFLEDTINLEILNVPYKGRLNLQRDFAKIRDQSKNILKENNISYVYTLKSQGFEEDEGKMGIKKIFENDEVKIFKVL